MCNYTPCLQNGKFLVKVYITHQSDVHYITINQWYWLQYHGIGDIQTPTYSSETHLIWPSNTSAAYAARHHIVMFRKWINLTHEGFQRFMDTNLALGRSYLQVPSFDFPTYSIHVDHDVHVAYADSSVAAQIAA